MKKLIDNILRWWKDDNLNLIRINSWSDDKSLKYNTINYLEYISG